jgi:hypothetical protein
MSVQNILFLLLLLIIIFDALHFLRILCINLTLYNDLIIWHSIATVTAIEEGAQKVLVHISDVLYVLHEQNFHIA